MSKTDLAPSPKPGVTPIGSIRWIVDIVSDQSVMRVGRLTETEREVFGSFGRTSKERYYDFGDRHIGGPAPEHMPKGAVIDQTNDPSIFFVKVRKKSLTSETEMLMGPEVFTGFGFAAP